MRFEIDGELDGPTNMARDTALLEARELACRVYYWNGPWVSLGRFQNPARDIVEGTQVPWVMRPTGGKAVLHGHDVTVGLAVPLRAIDCTPRELKKAYRRLIEPLAEALRHSGLNAVLAETTSHQSKGQKTADCFAFNSANDVVDAETGHKVCGCALQVTEDSILLQASIPYRTPAIDPAKVIREASTASVKAWDPGAFAANLEQALRYN